MGNASDLMATSTTADQPAVSGAAIELYSMTTNRGGHKYVVEVCGLPVAEGTDREQLTGVYYFLKNASEGTISELLGQVIRRNRTPLEV